MLAVPAVAHPGRAPFPPPPDPPAPPEPIIYQPPPPPPPALVTDDPVILFADPAPPVPPAVVPALGPETDLSSPVAPAPPPPVPTVHSGPGGLTVTLPPRLPCGGLTGGVFPAPPVAVDGLGTSHPAPPPDPPDFA